MSGFVVCLDNPWLGCSPDDFVTDPTASASQTKGLAEYKCPYCLHDKTIDEHLTSKGAAQFCLSRESDGILRQEKTHAYFYLSSVSACHPDFAMVRLCSVDSKGAARGTHSGRSGF